MLPQEDGACTRARRAEGAREDSRLGWERHSIKADSILRTSKADVSPAPLPAFFSHLPCPLSSFRLDAITNLPSLAYPRPQYYPGMQTTPSRGKLRHFVRAIIVSRKRPSLSHSIGRFQREILRGSPSGRAKRQPRASERANRRIVNETTKRGKESQETSYLQ
jgi:hypothetical protein